MTTITPVFNLPISRKAVNIVISYDKSGSMNDAANSKAEGVCALYSKNDLGKHSVEIVARSLTEADTLEIITYDESVHKIFPRTFMNDDGKAKAINAIKQVTAVGGTALWSGLEEAMRCAAITESTFGDTCVIMITDGVPSSSPTIGELAALQALREKMQNRCRLHTIGLGYDINSSLLSDLASEGGSFIFIPDGSMMITSWVNLLANEMNIVDTKVKVYDAAQNLVETIGTIKYGQSYKLQSSAVVTIKGHDDWTITKTKSKINTNTDTHTDTLYFEAIDVLKSICRLATANLPMANTMLQKFISKCAEHNVLASPAAHNLTIIEDMLGQVAEGISSQKHCNRWGVHYIRSLLSAHVNQNCLNFKDPGPMAYSNPLIQSTRDTIDAIANSIDPPAPSFTYEDVAVDYESFTQSFNNSSGGCFGGMCKVRMNDDTYKLVKDIVKDDIVYGGAKVVCVVVHTDCGVVSIGDNLYITPWHPVKIDGTWVFPSHITNSGVLQMDKVYNFVLDSVHTMEVNGIIACTLAHGFTGPVIEHAFYGTSRVHESLKKFPEYEKGCVVLTAENKEVGGVLDEDGVFCHIQTINYRVSVP